MALAFGVLTPSSVLAIILGMFWDISQAGVSKGDIGVTWEALDWARIGYDHGTPNLGRTLSNTKKARYGYVASALRREDYRFGPSGAFTGPREPRYKLSAKGKAYLAELQFARSTPQT